MEKLFDKTLKINGARGITGQTALNPAFARIDKLKDPVHER